MKVALQLALEPRKVLNLLLKAVEEQKTLKNSKRAYKNIIFRHFLLLPLLTGHAAYFNALVPSNWKFSPSVFER